MQYPLDISFKILSLASQVSVTDATGQLVFYVRQKLFKLKEAITIYADIEQTRPMYYINADRMLDISARYNITDADGQQLGAIKRQGMRSIIKAHYDILYNDEPVMTVREEKGWVKVLDALLGEVPILGMFTGYFLHPAYLVTRNPEGSFGGSGSSGVEQGELVMRLEKQPAFFEGKFILENKLPLDPQEESLVLLSLMMVLLLERGRG